MRLEPKGRLSFEGFPAPEDEAGESPRCVTGLCPTVFMYCSVSSSPTTSAYFAFKSNRLSGRASPLSDRRPPRAPPWAGNRSAPNPPRWHGRSRRWCSR